MTGLGAWLRERFELPDGEHPIVTLDIGAGLVQVRLPRQPAAAVSLADLQAVDVVTVHRGPFMVDAHWELVTSKDGVRVPMEGDGAEPLLRLLQHLDGFDQEAFLAAMSATESGRFRCWSQPLPRGSGTPS
ncbi:MAG: hypothetical protein JXR77_07530 [Lentisphaeria bacterium]|nr:hypothetical protein [Lentisphaeria bacterium]